MGRPRYQHPNVLKTKGKRPRWYIRVMVDVLVDRNRTERKEQAIYLAFCDEKGKREAEKLRDEKLKDVNNTPLVIQSQVLFRDLVEAYKSTYVPGLKPSSRDGYSHRLDKYIVPAFGTLRLFEVDAISVQQWVYRMEDEGLARTTRKSSLAVLRSLFDAAEEWGYFVGRNPAKKIKLGGGGEVWDKRALEPAEALLLLQALDGEEPLRTMVEVCLFVDLRSSEVRGLTWGAIDGTRSMVEVKQGRSQHGELAEPKSARGRRKLDLGPLVKRFVRPDGANPCDLIWPDASYFALQKKLRRVGKQVGIDFPGFGFHTLRRTHATWRDDLRLSSRPDEALVRDMGHADSRTTALYITGTKTGVVERLQNHVYFSGDSRDGRSVN